MNIKQTTRGVILSENAYYANCRVTSTATYKKNKAKSKEVARENGVKESDVKIDVRVFDEALTKKINTLGSRIRNHHYHMTFEIPSEGGTQSRGARLISARLVEDYLLELNSMCDEYLNEADSLVQDYEQKLEDRKVRLGDLFDANAYPSPEQVRSAYYAVVWVDKIPVIEGLDIGQFTESNRKIAEQREQEAVRQVTDELVGRMLKKTINIRDKMEKKLRGDQTRIGEAVFDSLRELCEDIIPASNFEGNEELVALAEEAKSLYRYNPEALKTTTGAQKSIAKQAKALEKKLNDFM